MSIFKSIYNKKRHRAEPPIKCLQNKYYSQVLLHLLNQYIHKALYKEDQLLQYTIGFFAHLFDALVSWLVFPDPHFKMSDFLTVKCKQVRAAGKVFFNVIVVVCTQQYLEGEKSCQLIFADSICCQTGSEYQENQEWCYQSLH